MAQPVAICYDMDALKETLCALKVAFPGNFTHCIAIKSNPLPFFLKFAVRMGCGLEAASYAEALLALRTGCPPDKIMFDSPAKTRADIRFALEYNIQINADNFFELDRIAEERKKLELPQDSGFLSSSVIGLRINPLVGEGKIKSLSVSDESSKFGIALTADAKTVILEYFRRFSWLSALHCHVGSQGCTLSQHAQGAKKLFELCEEINREVGSTRIRRMDIGGGLPVNFESEEISPTFDVYAKTLKEEVPALFRGDLTVITEYGRSVSAKAAWAACSIEYIKTISADYEIAVIQAGADLFLRTCYVPSNFSLRVTGHHRHSGKELQPHAENVKAGSEVARRVKRYDVAGPLCFGGDKITVNRSMPQLLVGDFVVVHDVGANTLSMFSRHCSRQAPPVYGYRRRQEGDGVEVVLIKEMEPVEDVLRFWSCPL
ncbi:hypothetical protein GUITHDRAFT_158931 [Guillardia theta CCMP2712]|uniref:Orn/DAP/Arg decarboxylase 2 N-terminal domain-containing protein n=1 Tax=Guillardia theta (strain CCMP2712) TaxID=905079 RepID=L1IA69_GUITC|nr:hypothetical protein GUITHDRAFT_158931 [Guillardia theta CCMP2712]EKX33156.1 hypothetical protein GUITHDRAFT_158931 [Guillardia theta CCMP2712]|eukprot:XP_005820136.1 hypothetical protein GUITHDRAFT_158931 [Guillardia theta CCMP2712]